MEAESSRRNHIKEEPWRRHHGGGIMEKESYGELSWRRNHGEGIVEEVSWRNYPGGGIMEKEDVSWKRNHGLHGCQPTCLDLPRLAQLSCQ